MATVRYLALLRGINVGGKGIVKMKDLRDALEAAGFRSVSTYIQSGNVIFEADKAEEAGLAGKMEKVLAQAFGIQSAVVLVALDRMRDVVARAPQGFGGDNDHRYSVVFLKEPLSAEEALSSVTLKEGVDEIATGPGVLYMSQLRSRLTASRLNRIASLPIYRNMTIRGWSTTVKLLDLMDGAAEKA